MYLQNHRGTALSVYVSQIWEYTISMFSLCIPRYKTSAYSLVSRHFRENFTLESGEHFFRMYLIHNILLCQKFWFSGVRDPRRIISLTLLTHFNSDIVETRCTKCWTTLVHFRLLEGKESVSLWWYHLYLGWWKKAVSWEPTK